MQDAAALCNTHCNTLQYTLYHFATARMYILVCKTLQHSVTHNTTNCNTHCNTHCNTLQPLGNTFSHTTYAPAYWQAAFGQGMEPAPCTPRPSPQLSNHSHMGADAMDELQLPFSPPQPGRATSRGAGMCVCMYICMHIYIYIYVLRV